MNPDPLAARAFDARNLPCLVLKSGYTLGGYEYYTPNANQKKSAISKLCKFVKKKKAKKICALHWTFDKLGGRVHHRTSLSLINII